MGTFGEADDEGLPGPGAKKQDPTG